ncbi:MAG: hypothetical protein ACM359_22900 [Bacillota bacterium]
MRNVAKVFALGIAIFAASSVQAAKVTASLGSVSPSARVTINSSVTDTAGMFNWTRSSTIDANNDWAYDPKAGSEFQAFCIELPQTVSLNTSYVFEVKDLKDAPLTAAMGATKANYLRELWATYFDADQFKLDAKNAAAFQVAVWEIVYENLGQGLNASAGSYQFSSATAGVINQANTWLGALTGLPTADLDNLRALVSTSRQDQVFLTNAPIPSVPLPVSAWAGMVLFAGMGIAKVRKARSL